MVIIFIENLELCYLADVIVGKSEKWDDDQHDQDENNDPVNR